MDTLKNVKNNKVLCAFTTPPWIKKMKEPQEVVNDECEDDQVLCAYKPSPPWIEPPQKKYEPKEVPNDASEDCRKVDRCDGYESMDAAQEKQCGPKQYKSLPNVFPSQRLKRCFHTSATSLSTYHHTGSTYTRDKVKAFTEWNKSQMDNLDRARYDRERFGLPKPLGMVARDRENEMRGLCDHPRFNIEVGCPEQPTCRGCRYVGGAAGRGCRPLRPVLLTSVCPQCPRCEKQQEFKRIASIKEAVFGRRAS